MIIYAVTNGYLDDVPVELISAWEQGLYRYMEANHPDVIDEIIEKSIKGKSKMDAALLKRLGNALVEYKKTAAPTRSSGR